MTDTIKIYTATIEHRHGVNFYTALTEEKLEEEIYGFVSYWWEDEINDNDEDEQWPIPENHAEAISSYFDFMADAGKSEYLEYGETQIKTDDLPTITTAAVKALEYLDKHEVDQAIVILRNAISGESSTEADKPSSERSVE